MAGRKAIPTQLKIIKGTDQPCRIRSDEPKPASDKIKMPRYLSDKAKTHWRKLIKELQDAKIITNIDVDALGMYCEAYATWFDANEKIQKFGPVIKNQNGYPVQSPYFLIANKAFDNMRKMLIEFGMTPASRSRIGTATKDTDSGDPWNDL
ncbi:MAG: phage terminase small subunit P27 family [Candidatus Thiodiazotropha lotti]|nr:phage terminase small subunit P27 family [Candidatus Thiodiazotropha lotti]